ncbi:hypothetical protein TNCV_2827591 [Trichonephila clavipes]|nr:hypothetical protein TNCV_2827591 [Trichonephila clavipes]
MQKEIRLALGKIIGMFPGKEGCTRVVKLKTTGGEIVRPVQRLFNLKLNNDDPIIFSVSDPVPSDKDIKILNSENSDCEKKTRSGRKCGQSASVQKKMTHRKTNLSRNSRKAKSVQRVIVHQTEEERASLNGQSRQRMTQKRTNEVAEERATRLEDACLRVRQSRSATSDELCSQQREYNKLQMAE